MEEESEQDRLEKFFDWSLPIAARVLPIIMTYVVVVILLSGFTDSAWLDRLALVAVILWSPLFAYAVFVAMYFRDE